VTIALLTHPYMMERFTTFTASWQGGMPDAHGAGWQRISGAPLGTAAPERPETESIRSLVPHFGTANAEEFAQNFVRQSRALVECRCRDSKRSPIHVPRVLDATHCRR